MTQIVAIDTNQFFTRVAVLKSPDLVQHAFMFLTPRDAFSEGAIVNHGVLAQAVTEQLDRRRVRARDAALVCSGLNIRGRIVNRPDMDGLPRARMRQLLENNFETLTGEPLPLDSIYFDCDTVRANAMPGVFVSYVDRSLVDNRVRLADTLGMRVAAMDAQGTCAFRALAPMLDRQSAPTVIASVSDFTTQFTVVHNGAVCLMRSTTDFSLFTILKCVSEQNIISMDALLEKLLSEKNKGAQSLCAAECYAALGEYLFKFRGFMKSQLPEIPEIKNIVLTGDAPDSPGLEEYIKEHTGLQLLAAAEDGSGVRRQDFAAATGAGLPALGKHRGLNIDYTPDSVRRTQRAWVHARLLKTALLTLVLALAVFSALALIRAQTLKSQYRTLSAKLEKSQTLMGQVKALDSEKTRLYEKKHLMDVLYKSQPVWSAVLDEITTIMPESLTIESLVLENNNLVSISGYAGTEDDVGAFLQRLEESRFFHKEEIHLNGVNRQTKGLQTVMGFTIQAQLNRGEFFIE